VLEWGDRGIASSGRGIGLAVASRLVAEMGGRLEVCSDGHSGTTVRVVLPTARLGSRPPTPTAFSVGTR
jgi:signal transduction histidine kinase